jgi:hypothetical protein
MRIDSSGNVGIGTASPNFRLQLNVTPASTANYLQITNGTTGTTSGDGMLVGVDSSNDAIVWMQEAANIKFATSNTERMRIDSGGNVLIGLTTSPTSGANTYHNLVIPNDIANGSLLIGTNASFLGRQSSDGSTILNTGQASIIFSRGVYGSTTASMTIDTSGNVGIGATANASAILDAQSTTKGVRFPNMTTTQKNAVSSPAAGLVVFDTTLAKLCVYSGSAWQTITSV